MDEKQMEVLKSEFSGIVKNSVDAMEENLKGFVSEQVAERVSETAKTLKKQREMFGRDVSGIDDETKEKFVKDLQNIVSGQLQNGAEKAAILTESDTAGGYTVPSEIASGIMRIAATSGLAMRDATKVQMGTTEYDQPIYTGADLTGEFLGEDEEGSESTITFNDAKLTLKTWAVFFRISNKALKYSNVSLADWVFSLIAEGMSVRVDKEVFIGGTFTGSPFVGILASADVTTYVLGGTVTSGSTGFDSIDETDISDIIAQVPESVQASSAFYFHRTVWAKIRSKSDSAGNLIYNQGMNYINSNAPQVGIRPAGQLLGFPVYTSDQLPAFSASATGTKFGVFGSLSKGVLIGTGGSMELAQSDSATLGGKNVFKANQKAFRATAELAMAIGLPSALVVIKTSNS